MGICWDYFDPDDFDPQREDEIIFRIRSSPNLPREVKKLLIQCWFDVVYGGNRPPSLARELSGAAMRAALKRLGAQSFEDLLG
ncbi:MAG: hypothetical protein QXD59_02950 [Candidatus Caldarchaeum sp.]